MSDERLVVQLTLSESTDFDELLDIENQLTLAFLRDRAALVDGHAMAGKAFSIFVVPRAAPDSVVDRIKAALAESGLLEEALIARRASAAEAWSVVWPAGYTGRFQA